MKDKGTFDESMEATIKRLNDAALSGAIVACFASDLNRALAILTRPATMEDRALDSVERLLYPHHSQFDIDKARALLREAGRVK